MKRLANTSLERFTSQLAARTPVPGGGCASALTAAAGVSLANMVIAYTLGKPAYKRFQRRLGSVSAANERLRRRFIALVDADAEAFASGDVRRAMAVPLEICRLCLQAAAACAGLCAKTNPRLASDLAAAVVLLDAGFVSAYYSLEANLCGMTDAKRVRAVRRDAFKQMKKMRIYRLKVEASVGRTLGR